MKTVFIFSSIFMNGWHDWGCVVTGPVPLIIIEENKICLNFDTVSEWLTMFKTVLYIFSKINRLNTLMIYDIDDRGLKEKEEDHVRFYAG